MLWIIAFVKPIAIGCPIKIYLPLLTLDLPAGPVLRRGWTTNLWVITLSHSKWPGRYLFSAARYCWPVKVSSSSSEWDEGGFPGMVSTTFHDTSSSASATSSFLHIRVSYRSFRSRSCNQQTKGSISLYSFTMGSTVHKSSFSITFSTKQKFVFFINVHLHHLGHEKLIYWISGQHFQKQMQSGSDKFFFLFH